MPAYISNTTDKNNHNNFMWKLLHFCLEWLRDYLGVDSFAIILEPRATHRIIYGNNRITCIWEPKEAEIRILKVSKFAMFESPHKVKLQVLKTILEENLPECRVSFEILEPGIRGLRIIWPEDYNIAVDNDSLLINKRKGISPTYSILSILQYKPNWISSGQCKGSEFFYDRMPIVFEDKQLVVYEGVDATYIMNENGLKYLHVPSAKVVVNSKDYITRIIHNGEYSTWFKKVIKYLR